MRCTVFFIFQTMYMYIKRVLLKDCKNSKFQHRHLAYQFTIRPSFFILEHIITYYITYQNILSQNLQLVRNDIIPPNSIKCEKSSFIGKVEPKCDTICLFKINHTTGKKFVSLFLFFFFFSFFRFMIQATIGKK